MGGVMRIHLPSLACCTILLAGLNPAKANTVTDFGFPPPGGVTATSTANILASPPLPPKSAATPGGITVSYAGFDPTAYGQLYFGLKGIDMGQPGGRSRFLTLRRSGLLEELRRLGAGTLR